MLSWHMHERFRMALRVGKGLAGSRHFSALVRVWSPVSACFVHRDAFVHSPGSAMMRRPRSLFGHRDTTYEGGA